MDLYLAKELAMPFLFGVGAFSSIGVSVGAVFELVRKVVEEGLPFHLALQILLLRMPYFIVLSFPMSTLLASMMAFGRLSNDSELVALRSCGVSVYRLVAPAVVLSLAVTGMTFVFNEAIVPAANYQATVIMERALGTDDEQPSFREENIFYREFGEVEQVNGEKKNILTRVFYAERYDGKQMLDLTVIDRSQAGISQIVTAKTAAWNPTERAWDFKNGTIYLVAPDGSYRDILRFEQQRLQLPRTPLDLAVRDRFSNELNIIEAQKRLELLRQTGERAEINKLELRIQQKYAFPFICLAFGLVGSALANRRHQRLGRATSFGVSVVVIFAYYLLAFVMDALGLTEVLSPIVATWTPLLLVFGLGAALLVRASR
jgi:lipopolysaccharide export system permease protein